MSTQDKQQQPERFSLPVPDNFDIRTVPRADAPQHPLVTDTPDLERYRVRSYSIPCENREDANRILNESLSPQDRRRLDQTLNTCRVGGRINMDVYEDENVRFGAKGIGQVRLRVTLPNPR